MSLQSLLSLRADTIGRMISNVPKHTSRNMDTQHEGMEFHRGYPGSVAETRRWHVASYCFQLIGKRILYSTSINYLSYLFARMARYV